MTAGVQTADLVALLLGSLRAVAWLVVAPPFSNRAIPAVVKALLSVAIALPLVPRLAQHVPALDTASLITAAVLQVVVGAALGFLCQLLLAAVQAAGDLLDLFGGFSLASAYDPLMLTQSAVLSRSFGVLATALLLATNGHLMVLAGFMRTYDVLPLDVTPDLAPLASTLVHSATQLLVAALQIAGPVIVVLFVTDVALGLLTRIAPALNPFALGFPVKIMVTLALVGVALTVLPEVVGQIADTVARATVRVVG